MSRRRKREDSFHREGYAQGSLRHHLKAASQCPGLYNPVGNIAVHSFSTCGNVVAGSTIKMMREDNDIAAVRLYSGLDLISRESGVAPKVIIGLVKLLGLLSFRKNAAPGSKVMCPTRTELFFRIIFDSKTY